MSWNNPFRNTSLKVAAGTTVERSSETVPRRGLQSSHVFAYRAALLAARDAYCADPATAAETYGPIATWDVSQITDMS